MDFFFGLEVGGEGEGRVGGDGVEGCTGGGAGGGVAGRDVHFCAGGHKGGGDHEADAFGAAGYEGYFALDGEEVVDVHFVLWCD